MIPLQLRLKNFLSYQETSLDFSQIHTACISGVNGAGKSSLLEAIAWCLWGKSRVNTEDDLIHYGAAEVRVMFSLIQHQQTFRVIRTRQRGHSTSLEFQVQTESGFRSLTSRNTRQTQQLIIQSLKLDYHTFINSAYLRQGRADEFMLKGAMERKQILARLLNLDQYDRLSDRAKEIAAGHKTTVGVLQPQLQAIESQLTTEEAIAQELQEIEQHLHQLQDTQARAKQQLGSWQTLQHQQQTLHQQLEWHQSQQESLERDRQRLHQERESANSQKEQLESLLAQETAITSAYQNFQNLQTQEAQLAAQFSTYQTTQDQLKSLRQTQNEQQQALEDQLRLIQIQLDHLHTQEQELQVILDRQPEIEAAQVKLQQARDRLNSLDRLQLQVSPLLHHRQNLQSKLDQATARCRAKLEELQATWQQLQTEQAETPLLEQAAEDLAGQIAQLEKKRIYQQRVLEKGQERRNMMERLQAQQRSYESQLDAISQKLQLLKQRSSPENGDDRIYPPCPLCDRPLDEHHWHLVQEKHTSEQQQILNQIWVIREQLATSELEIKVFRQEYRDLDRELAGLSPALEKRGQLKAVLDVTGKKLERLQQLRTEILELEDALQTGSYAQDLYAELQTMDQRLQKLNYDEKDHVLARGQVEKWRWVDIKRGEIKSALKQQRKLQQDRPELEAQYQQLSRRLDQLQTTSTLQRQIQTLERQLAEMGYDPEAHQTLLNRLREAQSAQFRYQQLEQAQEQYPQVNQTCLELDRRLDDHQQRAQELEESLAKLNQILLQNPDATPQVKALERQIQEGQQQREELLSRQGRLQQQQQHFKSLNQQYQKIKQQLETAQRNYRVYTELTHAFGRKGIQSLMIENILPELEAQTNRVLARLSSHQLHVQFITQKSQKTKKDKWVETLDILIADSQGTRPYETYSGGETFRVNFAIRLALAKLLAQQSGTALQMLIIDEGFGTQDEEGCDRLIAAINAISPEFACILTITHLKFFKEAFPVRIEVTKTATGSQLSVMH
ncbi:AAA family ATPase [Roseofilum capinflatum]|uniref:Nuclease SbcCD subunit C n=1 Tax=Roseofilum capinflatum BLCC-M114 TaxID=3022440 RepID=A0ABT7B243_9CYAN|nr:SMC family ATPase [Roseofilum capinflatum]MDJ1173210.1 SMC family ATPase [Roseofilum capinflatum BLCC-M114]